MSSMCTLSARIGKSFLVLLISTTLGQCTGDSVSPGTDSYSFVTPSNFPPVDYTLLNNPPTKEGFELGRMIFYDLILSLDSTIACANCHQQARAFSDPVHRLSRGVNDVEGIRNAPAIQNMAFQNRFFWDGGVNHLDFVPINAITNELEMHENVAHVVKKLQRSKVYPTLFSKAFGSDEISSQKMLYALSQFMVLMVSSNSKYDQFVRGEGVTLSSDELAGRTLFQQKCAGCHASDLFTDGTFRNNGLDASFESDLGRARITEQQEDRGKFKVPSLRNAELTPPYMHDGRFKTLDQVIDHYRNAIVDSPTLDPQLRSASKSGLQISDTEKAQIIAFIKTLTDHEFVQDKRFSQPIIQ